MFRLEGGGVGLCSGGLGSRGGEVKMTDEMTDVSSG